ncbi:hypothetical protein ACWGID_17845 [Kribbella sp. NPDC054772]|jgi:predicted Kef-type K+ transport protein
MGQFDRFIDRDFGPPPAAARVFAAVMVVSFTGRAVHNPTFETVAAAVLMTAVMLPGLIGPAALQRVSSWERAHPVADTFVMLIVFGGGLFLLLRPFLSRTPSAEIAVPTAVVLVVVSVLLRRKRAAG